MRKIKLALHWQMGIALLLGLACGIIFADSYCIWYNAVKGLGQIFLRAINMIVIPDTCISLLTKPVETTLTVSFVPLFRLSEVIIPGRTEKGVLE